jgi:protoporphyrinogen oxidase
MISRRDFLNKTLGAAGAAAILSSCTIENKQVSGKLLGPNVALGHRLRNFAFEAPSEKSNTPVVIVGGGIAGLSAAWHLKKHHVDFTLLELEQSTGGNSTSGENNISAYPWGAHYLPIPNPSNKDLIDFLTDVKVITGFENELPVYNEYYLCFEPKERIYIHDHWQEGLLPVDGVPAKDRTELHRFTKMMEDYKAKIGADGKEAFCIPAAKSSLDPTYTKLDLVCMKDFLIQERFTSPYLFWYVNYCCADDYGANIKQVSAWAGIHYFASRKGKAVNAPSDAVLTWPEGNGWLAKQLREKVADNIRTNSLVYQVTPSDGKVSIKFFDALTNITKEILAEQVIMATPQFVNERLISGVDRKLNHKAFNYSPWMVANISLSTSLDERRGEGLCWDNVIYGSNSLGYVNATQQHINRFEEKNVITYYLPLTGNEVNSERQRAFKTTYDEWVKFILQDLKAPHPKLISAISNIDVWRWGHGMIRPDVGFIFGQNRQAALQSINDKIHFAHSDLSGISIFEEAFYHGAEAAKKIIHQG